MARRAENPLLIFFILVLLVAGLGYFLLLVWEIPSPAQTNVQCPVSDLVFEGQNVPADQICAPSGRG